MAIQTKVGTFAANVATGTQNITGLGFTPVDGDALVLWSAGAPTALDTVSSSWRNFIGMASAPGNQYCAAGASQDAASNTSRKVASTIIGLVEWGEVNAGVASFSAWVAGGFQLNWTTAPAAAYQIHYLVIHGCTAKVLQWTLPTVAGNKPVTGAGFLPTAVLHAGMRALAASSLDTAYTYGGLVFGVQGASADWAFGVQVSDNKAITEATYTGTAGASLMDSGTAGGGNASYRLNRVSLDADGFTVNCITDGNTSVPSAAIPTISLCLAGVRAVVGTLTKPTAAAPVSASVTGMPFTPLALLLATSGHPSVANTAGTPQPSLGAVDSALNHAGMSLYASHGSNPASSALSKSLASASSVLQKITTTVAVTATVSALNADGFTLAFSANDASADTIGYLALAAPLGDIVTQEAVEVFTVPDTQRARLTQEAVEVYTLPQNQQARVTQQAIESLVRPSPNARLTHAIIESLVQPSPGARLTHAPIETLTLLRVPGSLQIALQGSSTVTLVSLVAARNFSPVIHGTSTVAVALLVLRRIVPVIDGRTTVSVHLDGTAAVIELRIVIVGEATVTVRPTITALGAFSWRGEGNVFIRATAQDLQLGAFSWKGTSHLSILPGFTPTGKSAEQAIHVAEADGGNWTATYQGETTTPLSWNITASQLENKLDSLSTIGIGDVVVTGGPGGTAPFLVKGSGSLAEVPMGLISVDGSNLSGPPGLHPHVGVISLSPGYSAADDYGTVDDIQVKVQGYSVAEYWTFQGVLHGLKVTEADLAGDESATWEAEFTPPYQLPRLNAKVIISDLRGPWWAGYLENPRYHVTANGIQGSFSARGRFTVSNDNPWPYKREFKDGTNAREIIIAARDELSNGELSTDSSHIVPGKPIVEDVDLYNHNLAQVLDTYTALGGADDSSLTYGVRLPLDGPSEYPILYVEPEAIGPTYWVYLRDGVEVELEYDSAEIITRHAVPWEVPGDSLGRSGISIVDHSTGESPHRLRTQVVTQSFPSSSDATAYGELLGVRHGQYRIHGGTLSIPGGVPVFTATGHVFPHWRIRPNQVFTVGDLPGEDQGLIGVFLRGTKFSWDQVTDAVSIACGRLNDLKRVFRQLVNSPDQLQQQPNEPVDRNVTRAPDQSLSSTPWRIQAPGSAGVGQGFDPHLPDPTVVPLPELPASVRTIVLMMSIPRNDTDTEAIVEIAWDCILRQITLYGPPGQTGAASVVIGHSTYDSYGAISNLANLSVTGNPGKAREANIAQQLLAGDVVYAALPTPIEGYSHIYVALACERSW